MMQFTMIVEVPDFIDRQGIPIAQALRDAADVVETSIPVTDRILYDSLGTKRCAWTMAPVIAQP